MVTETERRDNPEYSLLRVRELAAQGHVRYLSGRVQRDVENLSYAPEDVHKCLQTLNNCHFHHAERYAQGKPWFDVYLLPYASEASPQTDKSWGWPRLIERSV
jgi:motility quorum-sensing regulator / GCU-specific mRNA interferase toxin